MSKYPQNSEQEHQHYRKETWATTSSDQIMKDDNAEYGDERDTFLFPDTLRKKYKLLRGFKAFYLSVIRMLKLTVERKVMPSKNFY